MNFLVSGRISVVMSTLSVFGLSYGRSDNEFCAEEDFLYLDFLTGALPTNFARKRVKTRYLILFRAMKNCVIICRANLLYEMG